MPSGSTSCLLKINLIQAFTQTFCQPLDRAALLVMAVLALVIGLLVGGGDHTVPLVREFSWHHQQVGSRDTAFVLTFNRPMNWDSVAANLKIQPSLPGKLSWSGRRLAYTLLQPIPYGQQFQVELAQATEARVRSNAPAKPMRPFVGEFRSRDRAFVYLGVAGHETGRLVLRNLTHAQTQILTPPNLTVLDFKPVPERDRILFTAVPRTDSSQDIFEQQLYSVTTGLSVNPQRHPPSAPGQMQLLLDNTDYQILNFDVAVDGGAAIVQRFARQGEEPVSLWRLPPQGSIQQLPYTADGKFLVTPDSQSLAILLNQGVALVSMTAPDTDQPVTFFPQFRQVLGFSQDGTAALMERQESNSTRSLFLVTNDGTEQALLTTTGYVLAAQFDAQAQQVYCLYSEYNANEGYRSDLHLSVISTQTQQVQALATLAGQITGHISLAPDGAGLLYEELTVTDQPHSSVVRNLVGQTITDSTLWLLPLSEAAEPQIERQPQAIARGIKAQWLP